jgi:hypothetical protein
MNLGDPVPFDDVKREHTRLLLTKYPIKTVAQILGRDESSLYRYRRKQQIERVVPPPPPIDPANPPPPEPPDSSPPPAA